MLLRSLHLVGRGGQGKCPKVDFKVLATRELQSCVGSRGEKDRAICGLFYSPSTKKKKYFFHIIFFSLLFSWKCVLGWCFSLSVSFLKNNGYVLRCFSRLTFTENLMWLCFQAWECVPVHPKEVWLSQKENRGLVLWKQLLLVPVIDICWSLGEHPVRWGNQGPSVVLLSRWWVHFKDLVFSKKMLNS